MQLKKAITAGAVLGSLGLGAAAGAVLFSPALGLAQESTPSPSSSGDTSTDDASSGLCGPGAQLDAAAEAIGIDESDLLAALRDGQTIAEVAEANGVAVDAVIDAMVADAEAAIDQAVEDGDLTQAEADAKKADLQDRITAAVNGELSVGRGPWGHGFQWGSSADDSEDSSTSATTSV